MEQWPSVICVEIKGGSHFLALFQVQTLLRWLIEFTRFIISILFD